MAVCIATGTAVHHHELSGGTATFHPRLGFWTLTQGVTATVTTMVMGVHRPFSPESSDSKGGHYHGHRHGCGDAPPLLSRNLVFQGLGWDGHRHP
jgi:hypothetical protein